MLTSNDEQPWTSFWHDSEEEHYALTDINLDHPIKLTRIAMRTLVSEDRKGVVIPIASVGGLAASYSYPIYIATKHAIVGFTKSMKMAEKYEGVKVVTVCPGVSPLTFTKALGLNSVLTISGGRHTPLDLRQARARCFRRHTIPRSRRRREGDGRFSAGGQVRGRHGIGDYAE